MPSGNLGWLRKKVVSFGFVLFFGGGGRKQLDDLPVDFAVSRRKKKLFFEIKSRSF
jgi:hypothetical protein